MTSARRPRGLSQGLASEDHNPYPYAAGEECHAGDCRRVLSQTNPGVVCRSCIAKINIFIKEGKISKVKEELKALLNQRRECIGTQLPRPSRGISDASRGIRQRARPCRQQSGHF